MTADLYPCFLTVKKLVYMIDGSLACPFFARNSDGSIFGSQHTTEWHNESKNGAFMINWYIKDDFDFTTKLKKIGKQIFESEKLDEAELKKFFEEQDISDNEETKDELEEADDEIEIWEA